MIDYDLYCQIKEYANQHYINSKDLYIKRKQDPAKMFDHIVGGKVAEWCAYLNLKDQNYILDPPDMEIYEVKDKSHEADLIVTGKDNILFKDKIFLHVKSIRASTFAKYPPSFLIQKTDPLVKYPKSNHYFYVLLEHDEYTYNSYAWLCSTDADYSEPMRDLPSNYAVYV